MKFAPAYAAVLLLLLPALVSCDKITELTAKMSSQKKGEAQESSPGGSGAAHPMLDTLRGKMEATRGGGDSGPVVRTVSDADYDAFLASSGKLVVVDYYADWCGPCKRLSPILEHLAAESGGNVLIGKVNVDASPVLAEKAGVRSIPDVRLFRDGKQVDRFVGVLKPEEIKALFAKHSEGLDQKGASDAVANAPVPDSSTTQPKASGAATFQRMDKDWMPPGIQKR